MKKIIILTLTIFLLFSCGKNNIEENNNTNNTTINTSSGNTKKEEIVVNKYLGAGYEIKEDGVYYYDEKIKKADRNSFKLLNNPIWSEYAEDENNIYGFGNLLDGAKENNFEVLSFRYAKDNNFVYCFGEKLNQADTKTFFNDSSRDTYAKDNNNVYDNCDIIKEADAETFEVIDGRNGISKDKNYIFCRNEKITGADNKTYEIFKIESAKGVMGTAYSRDKNYVYYSCSHIIENADSESFEIINPFFAKDKNYVFHYNKIIEGVDPNNYNLEELEKMFNN